MATEKFANNAQTMLVGDLNDSVTSITVASGSGFPGEEQFRIRIDNELLLVTTGGSASTTWTVARGVEGTMATAHCGGALVTHGLTAGAIQNLDASVITTGTIDPERLGSGTPSGSTVLYGDGSWATPPGGSGTVTSVDMSVPSVLSVSGNPITTSGKLEVTYSGTALPVANGGTNSTTALNNSRIMVSKSGAIVEEDALTNGQLLIGSTGNAPARATLTPGPGISITSGAGSITIGSSTPGPTLYNAFGTTGDSYLLWIQVDAGAADSLLLWGTIKCTNSNDLGVKVSLTDRFGGSEDVEFNVPNFSSVSFNLLDVFPGAISAFPPYVTCDISLKSAFPGNPSDFIIRLAKRY